VRADEDGHQCREKPFVVTQEFEHILRIALLAVSSFVSRPRSVGIQVLDELSLEEHGRFV
jgi:hypothetical protein